MKVVLRLSSREKDLVRAAMDGKTAKQTAFELGLSEQTVENYRSRLYEKLAIHRSGELAKWGYTHPRELTALKSSEQ